MMNNKHIRDFKSNGFVLMKKLISNDLISSIRPEIESLMQQKYETDIIPDKVKFQEYNGKKVIHSQCNVWKANTSVENLVLDKKIAEVACLLMEWDGVKLNQDTLFHVPPGCGPTSLHQDNPYQDWHTSKGVITAVIALENIEKDMGGLIFIPKSHNWISSKETIKEQFIGSLDPEKDFSELSKPHDKKDIVKHEMLMQSGDVSFHHGDIWHGSGINNSDLYRKTISIHYMEKNAKFLFEPKNPWFSRYMLKNSNKMEDTFFPTLFSTN